MDYFLFLLLLGILVGFIVFSLIGSIRSYQEDNYRVSEKDRRNYEDD